MDYGAGKHCAREVTTQTFSAKSMLTLLPERQLNVLLEIRQTFIVECKAAEIKCSNINVAKKQNVHKCSCKLSFVDAR